MECEKRQETIPCCSYVAQVVVGEMQVLVCVGRFEIKQGILYDSVIIVPQCTGK